MKKLFLIGLFLLIACRGTTLDPIPTPVSTPTRTTPTSAPLSSAQGATVPPIDTPVPTPSLTPTPPDRYFTEEFNFPLTYWSTLFASGDSSRVEIKNENSFLTFELYAPITWIYAIYGAFDYENVYVETEIDNLGSNDNLMGLVCYYDEQKGWYEFIISSNGNYSVLHGQWLAEGIASYALILEDTSDQIAGEHSTNEIGLICNDNILQLYINGKLIRNLNVEHIGLTGGKVGISLGSFEESPVILSVDWVKVSRP